METKNNQYLKEVRFRVPSTPLSSSKHFGMLSMKWKMKNEKWLNIAFNNTKHYKNVKSGTVHKLKSNPNPKTHQV